jgi:hypothetical protein
MQIECSIWPGLPIFFVKPDLIVLGDPISIFYFLFFIIFFLSFVSKNLRRDQVIHSVKPLDLCNRDLGSKYFHSQSMLTLKNMNFDSYLNILKWSLK